MQLSVIIPAFNEAQRLPSTIRSIQEYLENHYPQSHEILVIDDGSEDATVELATQLVGRSKVFRLGRNQGKGAAVKFGMLRGSGDRLLFVDADGASPISEERKLSQAIEEGADIAMGSRAKPGGTRHWLGDQPPTLQEGAVHWHVKPVRHLSGRIFSKLVQTKLGLPFGDTQCGFKMFRNEVAKVLFERQKLNGFNFDVEILYLASQFGYKIEEVATSWRDIPGSKVRLFRDATAMYRDLLKIKTLHHKRVNHLLVPKGAW